MSRSTALTLLAVSVAVAAPVPKEKGKNLYFPVVEGAKRVLEQKVNDTVVELTETVVKVEEKDSKYTVTIDRSQQFHTAQYVYEVSDKGVDLISNSGRVLPSPCPQVKAAKPGEKWEVELPGLGNRKYTLTTTQGKEEEVEVPAGKFKAIRVDSESNNNGRTRKSTSWYTVGVGLIKYESDDNGRKVTRELKSFTPGKEEKKDK